jgi:hypothetical protein
VQSTTVGVTSTNGALRIGQADVERLVATHDNQWLLENGAWALMTAPDFSARAPDAARKYTFGAGDPVMIAGRPVDQIEVRMGGRVLERLFFDQPTGLLLCREQLDNQEGVVRVVSFEQLRLGGTGDAKGQGATPQGARTAAGKPVSKASGEYAAPASLSGGYQRVGLVRRPGALQVVYSDGVYSLSVFEQHGGLASGAMPPGGELVAVGRSKAMRYAWAGGQILVWQAGPSTYTVIGEAATDDVLAAARSLPSSIRLSNWHRVRRHLTAVMRAISGA